MANELIEISDLEIKKGYEESTIMQIVERVRDEVVYFEHDMTTAINRAKTKSLSAKVKKFKTRIDLFLKMQVSDLDEKKKISNKIRKEAREELSKLSEIARQPLTQWEDKIKQAEQAELDAIKAYELSRDIEMLHLEAIIDNTNFDNKIAERKRLELDRIEEIKKQAVLDAQIKFDNDKQVEILLAKQAEEKAKHDLLVAKNETDRIIKQARIDSDYKIEQAEIKFETDRKNKLKIIEIEKERKLEDQENITSVSSIVKKDLMNICGIDERTAITIVKAIRSKKIRKLFIDFIN